MIFRMFINSLLSKATLSTLNTVAGEANYCQTHAPSRAKPSILPDAGWLNGLWAGCRSDAVSALVGARSRRTGFRWFTSLVRASSLINQFSDRFLVHPCYNPSAPCFQPRRPQAAIGCFGGVSHLNSFVLKYSGQGIPETRHTRDRSKGHFSSTTRFLCRIPYLFYAFYAEIVTRSSPSFLL